VPKGVRESDRKVAEAHGIDLADREVVRALFYRDVKALNGAFGAWVSQAVQKGPQSDLSPGVKGYLDHYKALEEAYDMGTTNGGGADKRETAPPLFGAGVGGQAPTFGASKPVEAVKPAAPMFGAPVPAAAAAAEKPAAPMFGAPKPAAAAGADKPAAPMFGAPKPAAPMFGTPVPPAGADKPAAAPVAPMFGAGPAAPSFKAGASPLGKPAGTPMFGAGASSTSPAPVFGAKPTAEKSSPSPAPVFGAKPPAETSSPPPAVAATPIFGAGATPKPMFGAGTTPAPPMFGAKPSEPSDGKTTPAVPLFGGFAPKAADAKADGEKVGGFGSLVPGSGPPKPTFGGAFGGGGTGPNPFLAAPAFGTPKAAAANEGGEEEEEPERPPSPSLKRADSDTETYTFDEKCKMHMMKVQKGEGSGWTGIGEGLLTVRVNKETGKGRLVFTTGVGNVKVNVALGPTSGSNPEKQGARRVTASVVDVGDNGEPVLAKLLLNFPDGSISDKFIAALAKACSKS